MPAPRQMPPRDEDDGALRISRRPVPVPTILTTFAVALTLALLWKLSFVLLMGFAAILLGIALRKTANYLMRYLHLSSGVAVLVVLAVALTAFGLLAMIAGPQITQQMRQLFAAIPQAWSQVMDWLNSSAIGNFLLERARPLPMPPSKAGRAAARLAVQALALAAAAWALSPAR